MAKNIKGITIEIGAETSGLDKALKGVNKSSKDLQRELRDVDKLLRFNPGNTELIAQKQKILGDQVGVTKEKLDKLREAEKQVQDQFQKGEISEEQYRAFQREIVETESKLDHYNNKLKEVSQTKDEFAQKIENLGNKLNGMGTKMQDVGKNMAMKVTAPIIAAGGAMVALAKKSGDVADRLLDLSDITGMSTDSIQEWQHVATVAGVSTEVMTSAVEGLVKKIPQLEAEGGKATEAMGKLGISFSDLKTMTPDEQMDTMINLLADMDDPLERNAIGAQLFGGAWKDLAPILGMGADEIAKTREEAHELGRVMSEDSLQDANDFRIAMDKLKGTFEGATNQIGAKFAPILSDTLIPLIEEKVIPGILKLVDKVGEMIEWWDGLSDGTKKAIGTLTGIVVALGPVLMIFGKLTSTLGVVVTAISKIGPAITLLKPVFAMLSGPAGWIAGAVAAGVLLYKNWDKIKEKASILGEGVSKAFTFIKDTMTEKIESARDAVGNAIDKMKDFFKFKWELPKIKLPKFSITGKFSLRPPQVPKLSVKWNKDGAIFDKPTIFHTMQGLQGVGEAGQEAVIPIEKLKGWIFEWLNTSRDDGTNGKIVGELQNISRALENNRDGNSNEILSNILNALSGESSQQEAVFKIGEVEFAKAVVKTVRQYEKQTGKPILL